MAVDIAATVLLSENDRDLARLTQMEAAAAMWGGGNQAGTKQAGSNPEVWDTIEEF